MDVLHLPQVFSKAVDGLERPDGFSLSRLLKKAVLDARSRIGGAVVSFLSNLAPADPDDLAIPDISATSPVCVVRSDDVGRVTAATGKTANPNGGAHCDKAMFCFGRAGDKPPDVGHIVSQPWGPSTSFVCIGGGLKVFGDDFPAGSEFVRLADEEVTLDEITSRRR